MATEFKDALTLTGGAGFSVATTATAAGTTVADATALTAAVTKVTTAAASTGVKLPSDTPVGGYCFVQNGGANDLEVYPPDSSSTINAAAAGAGLTLAAATDVALFAVRISATAWLGFVVACPAT